MTRKTEKKTNAEFRKRTLYLKSKTNLWIKENPKTEKTGAHTFMVTGQSTCQAAVNPTEMLRLHAGFYGDWSLTDCVGATKS